MNEVAQRNGRHKVVQAGPAPQLPETTAEQQALVDAIEALAKLKPGSIPQVDLTEVFKTAGSGSGSRKFRITTTKKES